MALKAPSPVAGRDALIYVRGRRPLPPLAGGSPELDPPAEPPAGDPPSDPPKTEDEPKTFDAEYVQGLRAQAASYRTKAKRAEELEQQLQEIEDAKKSDLEKAQARVADLEQRAKDAELALLRRRVADETKLAPSFADRLRGSTEEELRADAEALQQLVAGQQPKPTEPPKPGEGLPTDVPRGTSPSGNHTISADEARRLAKENPTEFNRLFDEGKLPAEALS